MPDIPSGKTVKKNLWILGGILALILTLAACFIIIFNLAALEKQRVQLYQTIELAVGQNTMVRYIMRQDRFTVHTQNITMAMVAAGVLSMGMLIMLGLLVRMALRLEKSLANQSQLNRDLIASHENQVQMTGAITHNARHYLNIIKGRLYLMGSKLLRLGQIEPHQQDINLMDENVKALQQLIGEIFTDNTETKPDWSEINLQDLLQKILRSFEYSLHHNRISVKMRQHDDLPLIMTWPYALEQVVLNLLDNAVKYSPAESVVTIWLEHDVRLVRLFIRDQGPGIPDAEWENIFVRYTRLVPNTRGTGLGLSNSRKLMRAIGGDVQVAESRVGHGTTFVILLPLRPGASTT